ncbi:hypothetical protein A3F06_03590 [candidate division TM6 bacterium RIFCSPHIGHO2_12_FULL_36_22]|nr:MAG: hypothetical protein A3F06_03590 [candidate division TM6 bacterium RIFCSPHIGHO2_12_FULL_36_22]
MNASILSPAQLWIGNTDIVLNAIQTALQKRLCLHEGCGTCISCRNIRQQEHYATMWFKPEKATYTVEQFDILFDKISLQLDEDQHFFFIIQHADVLGQTCSNKLLKVIEEPPLGYHFILATEHKHQLLKTIQSRCLEFYFTATNNQKNDSILFTMLTSAWSINPIEFLQELDKTKINEYESRELLDQLYNHWSKQYLHQPTLEAERRLTIIAAAIERPPMPGSSNLFWKNLVLNLQ